MPMEFSLLLIAVVAGAAIQTGVGIGFSMIAGPVLMIALGPATAVPLLLLMNFVISGVAVSGSFASLPWKVLAIPAGFSVLGIGLGIGVFSMLSEPVLLAITGLLLLIGGFATLIPAGRGTHRMLLFPISLSSGLATVWAATPGPLMALGLLLAGYPATQVRRLVQPIALIAYGIALALHVAFNPGRIAGFEGLWVCLFATVAGALAGLWIGPRLPGAVLTVAIQIISGIGGVVLLHRALFLV